MDNHAQEQAAVFYDNRNKLFNELKEKLQITIDLEHLLKLFYNELQKYLPITGFSFQNLDHTISLSFGEITQEYCSKQLILNNSLLGTVRFFPKHLEVSILDSALSCLLFPLRNALQYHVALLRASRDQVTGLGNRYALETRLTQLDANNMPLSLIIIDVDNFKRLNDLYGHTIGDYALSYIASLLKHIPLCTHASFRYGGDEYLILLPNISKINAVQLSKTVQEAIKKNPFKIQDQQYPITVSMGVAHREMDGGSFQELFELADKALYMAKASGKNCINYV
jgi:diguanylate cyclase (GGDEF)-like protein